MKRLVMAVVAAGTVGALAVLSPASAAQVCVQADIDVNGTAQSIEQCLPE